MEMSGKENIAALAPCRRGLVAKGRASNEAHMIYAVNYDLKKPGQDYTKLHEAIKACGAWWHYLGSTWLVDTSLNAQGIWDAISAHVDANDRVLIIGVTRNYQGWLPKEAWDWIDARSAKLAA